MKACLRTEWGSTGHQPPPRTDCANQCGPKAMRGCWFKPEEGPMTQHALATAGIKAASAVCDPQGLQASWAIILHHLYHCAHSCSSTSQRSPLNNNCRALIMALVLKPRKLACRALAKQHIGPLWLHQSTSTIHHGNAPPTQ
jgi:hypothetical protein